MTAATDRLAGILARGIVNDEGFAYDLAEVSETLRRYGHHAFAAGMLRLSRHHRIKGMEGRGKLVALRDRTGRAEDPSVPGGYASREADG